MKLTPIYIILIGLILIQSCRKDKLEGEKEILKGKWEWVYTRQFYDNIGSPNDPPADTLWAGECYDRYELDFLEKGIAKSKVNGKVKKRKRIVFDRFKTCPQNGGLSIIINLGGSENNSLGINILSDENILLTQNTKFTKLPFVDNLARSFPGDNVDTNYTHFYRRVD